MRNDLINKGCIRIEKAIIEWAKQKIAAIESNDLSSGEKQNEIKRIESERDEKLACLESPHIA